MIKYESVFFDMQVSLAMNVAIFEQSCEELLRGLMLPDNQFCELVDRHKGWDDKELDEKLRYRLGKDYPMYKLSVKQLGKRLDLLRKS